MPFCSGGDWAVGVAIRGGHRGEAALLWGPGLGMEA